MYGTAELWNNGRALEPGNELFTQHIGRAAKRAIAALKGRKVGPREYNTQRSAVLRTVHSILNRTPRPLLCSIKRIFVGVF